MLRKSGLPVVLLLLQIGVGSASAAEPEHYRVHARVAASEGRVEAHMSVRVRVREGENHIRLWLYPDRLAVAPSAMDERSWRWIYPGEVDRGGIEVRDVEVDGRGARINAVRHRRGHPRARDAAGADLLVAIDPGPARSVEITLGFTLHVPGRFGRLGREGGRLSLAAPWYPLVVGDDDAWAYVVPHRVEASSADSELFVADRKIGRAGVEERTAPYLPLLSSVRLHLQERVVRGVTIALYTPERLYEPPPPERRGEDGLRDLAHVDVGALVAQAAEPVIDSARAFGVPLPERIALLQIPSRTELVATAPGVVIFSDRLFQIFPIEQTLEFHRRALRRALFRHLSEPLAARVDRTSDLGWAADLRAVVLLDLDEARRQRRSQSVQELLSLFAFHPAVDQLLYAPQIAFEDTYFAAIEERDVFRDDPMRARRPLSSGRRILESARDALSEEAFGRFSAMLIHARRSARDALREAAPAREERLASWLRSSGEPVNYRLGQIRSARMADGRWRHRVEVFRDGATRAEPVEVLVHDNAGRTARGVWDAAGERGEVVLITAGPFGGAIVDPRQRLPQSPDLVEGHPRIDDATDHPWRPPILNAFLIDVFVTEALFTGLVDFALRRRYDLEHTIAFRLERTPALTGGSVRYAYGFGPKAHTNRRIGFISGGLSFERLHEFFGDSGLGGWRGQLFLQGGLNTVNFSLDPREAYWLTARLVGGLAVRDDESLGGTFRGSVRGGMMIPLGLVNTLAIVAGGGFSAGDALPSELSGLGGRAVLRGFESDELLGRGSIYAVVEHRWSAVRDLAWNIAHLVWVRELQLVVFAGGGLVFGTTDERDVDGGAEVGGGLRFSYEYAGVQPGVIAIDVSVPITRADPRVWNDEGMLLRYRTPVGFYLSFDQYF